VPEPDLASKDVVIADNEGKLCTEEQTERHWRNGMGARSREGSVNPPSHPRYLTMQNAGSRRTGLLGRQYWIFSYFFMRHSNKTPLLSGSGLF
jgi:hypothetical protein